MIIKKTIFIFLLSSLFCYDSFAKNISFSGNFTQGGLIRGNINPSSSIYIDDKSIKISEEGWFVFGFGRNYKEKITIEVIHDTGASYIKNIIIKPREWGIQRINGIPNKMVTPPQSSLEKIHNDSKEVSKARENNFDETWFLSNFILPVEGVFTGFYGTRRILNGIEKQPHYGLDIAAPQGSPVVSPAPGRITLSDTGHYYTGGTIIIDHGHGLSSSFLHLDTVEVIKGQEVLQGQKIGTVGKTGRATGPHLDWRMNWLNQRIDPLLILSNN